jgi:hypothetical protein
LNNRIKNHKIIEFLKHETNIFVFFVSLWAMRSCELQFKVTEINI